MQPVHHPSPQTGQPRRVISAVVLTVWACGCNLSIPIDPLPPLTCDQITELFNVDVVLADPQHACFQWLDRTHGRVGRTATGSASIWRVTTDSAAVMVVQALHTVPIDNLAPAGQEIFVLLQPPLGQPIVPAVRLIDPAGLHLAPDRHCTNLVFHPGVAADQNAHGFRDILPRSDFIVGLLAMMDDDDICLSTDVNVNPPIIHDPDHLAGTSPAFTSPADNGLVLMIGFPRSGPVSGMAASVGQVLPDDVAAMAIVELHALGDEEGEIDYDPDAEFLVRGRAESGMSGGGVFDQAGRFLGIIVRASDLRDGLQYVRVVRGSWMIEQLRSAFDLLSPAEQEVVAPFLQFDLAATSLMIR